MCKGIQEPERIEVVEERLKVHMDEEYEEWRRSPVEGNKGHIDDESREVPIKWQALFDKNTAESREGIKVYQQSELRPKEAIQTKEDHRRQKSKLL